MEAAALPFPTSEPSVRALGDRLVVERLSVQDETAARVVQESDDPVAAVRKAIEIGARVMDREDVGQQADFVRSEFEKAARELEHEFVDRARRVSERLDQKVDEAFAPDTGHVSRALEKHFGDESSAAVQHRVRAVLVETSKSVREDVRKELSSDASPIAGFQRATLSAMKTSADQHAVALREVTGKLEGMKLEIAELRAEKERLAQVAAVQEKGTAKGRTYEEAVFEATDAIAVARGDDCDAVGEVSGVGGKKGDVVVDLDACAGPARGRIVLEAKDRKLSKNDALAQLDGALATRSADYAILVVPSEEELPARTHPLREYGGDKLFVVFDPAEGSRLALEVAYGLARARVLMARESLGGLDAVAVATEVGRAVQALEDVRRIKSQLTNASNGIDNARKLVGEMNTKVRLHLAEVDTLLAASDGGEGDEA